jgi:hypothetical protein
MSACTHPRKGIVTSHRMHGAFETVELGPHAESPVCDLPECIDEAVKWVVRMTSGKPAFHVPDAERGAGR